MDLESYIREELSEIKLEVRAIHNKIDNFYSEQYNMRSEIKTIKNWTRITWGVISSMIVGVITLAVKMVK
jgi:hypothetical protein